MWRTIPEAAAAPIPMKPHLEIRPIRSEELHLIAHYITGLQQSLMPLDPTHRCGQPLPVRQRSSTSAIERI
ncbi:MAG: hypothetical protein DCF18_12880 [Cyanobium sp.]|nr:MAG: hypothetical protein DCF18_12880 [Cyanobium sp.]